MTSRHDKGRQAARYLTGHSGIPSLHYDNGFIAAPFEYLLTVSTNRTNDALIAAVREYEDDMRLHAHIKVTRATTIDNAPVGMTLRNYARLLGAHYDAVVLPRIRRGDN